MTTELEIRATTDKQNANILTYAGILFNIFEPNPDNISIIDIAHSLSMQCRYNGHTDRFYSVAEHSWLVSQFVAPEYALWGLLHDATEAYLCDIPRPLKPFFPGYYAIEDNLMAHIARRFNLVGTDIPHSVKLIDCALLIPERDALMPSAIGDWRLLDGTPDLRGKVEIAGLTPDMAKHLFLQRFKDLTHGS